MIFRQIFLVGALGLLLVGAGCASAPQNDEVSSGSDAEESDAVASADEEEAGATREGGRMGRRGALQDKAGAGPRQILLLDSTCDAGTYTDSAENVLREKDLGTYTVVIAQYGESEPPKADGSCVKMSFPPKDIKSLREMMALLKEQDQQKLEDSGVSVALQQDLPGSCEQVAAEIAKRFPTFAEKALERCKQQQEQQEQEQQEGNDEELLYDSTAQQCGVKPDSGCSPSMSATEYVQYAMDYITPNDATVIAQASQYEDIGSMYRKMQENPWQSDTSLFGCSDKFQKPAYYLQTSPTISSSMMCGAWVGDCDDKADAFSSMLIASGLFPAEHVRVALGTVQFGKSWNSIGGHAFTEVYIEDEKDGHWVVVDAVMGETCYDNGECTSYDENDYIAWDYYNYVEYPVLEYWGWANNELYYIPSSGQGSQGLPAYWKEEAQTMYESM